MLDGRLCTLVISLTNIRQTSRLMDGRTDRKTDTERDGWKGGRHETKGSKGGGRGKISLTTGYRNYHALERSQIEGS